MQQVNELCSGKYCLSFCSRKIEKGFCGKQINCAAENTVFLFAAVKSKGGFAASKSTVQRNYCLSFCRCKTCRQIVGRCFEPSQSQRITPGLKTNFNLSPGYTANKSLTTKSLTSTKLVSTQT